MLAKKYKLKKKNDFKSVFKKGRFYGNSFLSVKISKNDLKISRFAFVVGLKISKKAVVRNKIKRLLSAVIKFHLAEIKTGFDIVFLPNPDIVEKDYKDIEKVINNLFKQANLWI